MSRHPSSRHTSNGSDGSDGTWFLEAVGAKEKAPTSIEAVERLESENAAPPEAPLAGVTAGSPSADGAVSFDGDPGTSTSSFHPVPAPPPPPDLEHPTAVVDPAHHTTDLRTETAEIDATATERPTERATERPEPDAALSGALRSRRNFRWPVVVVLIVAIVAVGVATWWLPRALDEEALAVRQSYYDTAVGLRNHLPASQGALDAVTNPGSDPTAVSAAVPTIAELDSRSFALEAATAEPLPRSLPLVPSGPVDELEPLQVRGNVLGTTGSNLATRIGDAYVYRTSIPALLDTGALPISATTQEINEISVRLAGSLATDAGIVTDLPDDPAFAATRTAATAAVERYGPWQDAYLGALTAEDTEAATALVDELAGIRRELEALLDTDLIAFRTEADGGIVELARELETYLEDVTRS